MNTLIPSMPGRRFLLAVSAFSALAVVTLASASAAPASPQEVSLKKADLPAGFSGQQATVLNNVQLSKITQTPKSHFDQHGRVSGYLSVFNNGSMHLQIIGLNSLYKTTFGAMWEYQQSSASDSKGSKPVAGPRIGNQSIIRVHGGGKSLQYAFDFRVGKFNNSITLIGKGATAALATHYARIIAGREARP
jgi:hypothetical protein